MANNIDELAHDACNEAISISMGMRLLAGVPAGCLTADQRVALNLIRESALRLTQLMETLKEATGTSDK